ncbi:probable bifunctional dTTP/UTP pyrophosphatase/methyltransferase protein isoform X2 [Ostrea edulis]|uniref:probable bifunctional dTTP/UTP pyrophosphatase/methyltransferase protein isoform X2 n=1 Tax=Ostrea edulis TaxID=37623 RepID=UPI00209590B9|nr:probable bifunctional dTTP/UTP pyrophosphatase/methyltransferase protein isoform X2 [Ostrea edulis]
MLEPILQQLNSKRIVLASSSPRRRQILGNINLKFETAKSNFEENLDKGTFSCPLDYVRETAKQKTLEVVDRLFSLEPSPDLIIGADTIVTNGKSIFEKPSSKDHAIEMITSFCGRSHKVLTSVVLVTPKSSDMFKGRISLNARLDITQFEEESEVSMPNLTEDIIKSYVNTGESMDKAGGYGIQAVGGSLVSGIHGDYFNVMGFPLHRFCVELRNICILR